MVNPRQRRKGKSSIAKSSRKRDRAPKQRNKRVEVKGPASFVQGWDKRKTARQNMVALGLLGSLDPRQSGGLERIEGVPFAARSAAQREEAVEPVASTSSGAIPQGFARIERDEDGNIIRITLADGETIDPNASVANVPDDAEDEDEDTPWGEPLNADAPGMALDEDEPDEASIDTRPRKQGIALTAAARPVQAKTAVAQAFETAAAQPSIPNRHRATDGELSFLLSLVRKYGDDVERMAKNIRANPLQRTPGQLRAAFKRCGGVEAVRALLDAPSPPADEAL